jgi:hypothetical protein
VLVWIGVALILFPALLKITAPYGRYSTANWGPMINNNLGWFIMELPALSVFLFFLLKAGDFQNRMVMIAFLLWSMHYFHRVIIFPFQIKTKGKKMPVVIMTFGFMFNLINGFINGYWLCYMAPDHGFGWPFNLRYLAGIILFISGFVINKYHDRILIKLRGSSKNGYKIPYGGLFKCISCPNFLGEIMEWGGFAVITWCLPSLSFFIWTIVNLVPRALDHHKWYRKNFNDYPKERKAVIPFVL